MINVVANMVSEIVLKYFIIYCHLFFQIPHLTRQKPSQHGVLVHRQMMNATSFASRFTNDDEGIHYYTGLETYAKLFMVLYILGPVVYELNYYHGVKPGISVEDQFFLTLIKLWEHNDQFYSEVSVRSCRGNCKKTFL